MVRVIIYIIRAYQIFISPFFPRSCRFYPTCSSYAHQAFFKYGIWKGGILTLLRLSRCHPFHPGGYDPVP